MQGRVKVVGDMGKVMALMPLTDSDEYRGRVAELAGADRLLSRSALRAHRDGALVVGVLDVEEGDLAGLGEHERGRPRRAACGRCRSAGRRP